MKPLAPVHTTHHNQCSLCGSCPNLICRCAHNPVRQVPHYTSSVSTKCCTTVSHRQLEITRKTTLVKHAIPPLRVLLRPSVPLSLLPRSDFLDPLHLFLLQPSPGTSEADSSSQTLNRLSGRKLHNKAAPLTRQPRAAPLQRSHAHPIFLLSLHDILESIPVGTEV